jgi:hypothetical protein
VRERFKLRFKAEALNFNNAPRFNNPSANVSKHDREFIRRRDEYQQGHRCAGHAYSGERRSRFGSRLSF